MTPLEESAVSYKTGWLLALGFELTYLSGMHRLLERSRGGAGIILKFERVRPPRQDAFQPLKAHEITPWFLDRTIRALKRWPVDIVGMDEVCRRASAPRAGRRFVALTFDGGTRDFVDFAYPLLAAHEVPFTLYLPSAFADGLGAMWWLALEQAIATHDRISLIIDHRQRHFETAPRSPTNIAPITISIAGCGRCRRTNWPLRRTISANAIPSIVRPCHIMLRCIGTMWPRLRRSAGDHRQQHGQLSGARQSR